MIRFLILFFFLAVSLEAADLVSEGTGYGASKGEAIVKAKQDALAKGIGQILVSQTEVENFMVKRDLVLTQTMGHIKKFDIISENKGPDGAWKVTLKAVVAKEGLAKDLAAMMILRESIGNPRIAIFINETNMGKEGDLSKVVETELIDFFKSKQFEVVDPNSALKFRESPDGIKALGGDPEASARIGANLNAEVMIVGSALARASDVSALKAFQGSGMKSASAVVSIKAVNVSTRRIMAAKSADAPSIHVNQSTAGVKALGEAVKKLLGTSKYCKKNCGEFIDALLKSWKSTANDGATLQVTVKNVLNFKQMKIVQGKIKEGVKKLDRRGFSKPEVKLDVVFQGSVDDFCDKMDGLVLVPGKAKLAVVESQGSTVVLTVEGVVP